MFCSHCGYRNRENSRFCEQCGYTLAGKHTQPYSAPPQAVVVVSNQKKGQSFFKFLAVVASYLFTGLVAGFLLIEVFPYIRTFLPPWLLELLTRSPNLR